MSQKKNKAPKAGLNKFRVYMINTLALAVVAIALIWAIRAYFHIGEDCYTNDAQVEEYINPINSKVQGYIKEIRFVEHQPIHKGDTIVVLDDRELKIAQAQAEAAYQNALAAKELTESSINTTRNNLTVSDANIAAAKARLTNVEQNYIRYANLLKDDAVTKAQYDQMKAEYDASKAQYVSLQSQRKSTQLAVVEITKRIGQNDAEVMRTKAALDMAKLNVSYSRIVAPYSCIAGRRLIQEGQLIQPGQQLLTIVKSNEKWVVANFREKQMKAVTIGKKVSIKVDALDGKEYEGVITAISGASGSKYSAIPVDNSTGNFVKVQQRFPVRIELTNANKKEETELLRAGMNVEIRINK
jgi:membrane fusion protein, multidrug efflux system